MTRRWLGTAIALASLVLLYLTAVKECARAAAGSILGTHWCPDHRIAVQGWLDGAFMHGGIGLLSETEIGFELRSNSIVRILEAQLRLWKSGSQFCVGRVLPIRKNRDAAEAGGDGDAEHGRAQGYDRLSRSELRVL